MYTFIKKIIKDYLKYPFHSLLYNFERNINFTLNTITIENTPQKMIKSSSNFSIFNNEFSTKIVKEIEVVSASSYSMKLLLLSDKRLLCFDERTICILDLQKNEIFQEKLFQRNTNLICVTELANKTIAGLLSDNTIVLWSFFTDKVEVKHIYSNIHNKNGITITSLSNNRIASWSFDNTIKIWNGEAPYTLIKQINLSKPQCCNSIIQITNTNYMITGMFTQQIYVWDLRTYQIVSIIQDVGGYFHWSDNKFYQYKEFSFIDDKRVIVQNQNEENLYSFILDTTTWKTIDTFTNQNLISSTAKYNNSLFLCNSGLLVLYNLEKKKEIRQAMFYMVTGKDLVKINDYTFAVAGNSKIILFNL